MEGLPDDLGRFLSQAESIMQGTSIIARVHRSLFESLVEQGYTEEQALEIIASLVRSLVASLPAIMEAATRLKPDQ